MEDLFKLGATVLSIIIKCATKSTTVCTICDGGLQLLNFAGDAFEQRKGKRSIDDVTDQIAKSCQSILEYSSANDARKKIIIDVVIKVVESTQITYELLFQENVNANELYNLLRKDAIEYRKEFDPPEMEIVDRLLRHVSSVIVTSSAECPDFVNHGIKYLITSLSTLDEKIETILTKVNEIDEVVAKKATNVQNFERIYRNSIIERYGWIRLLGANSLSTVEKKYQLSIAYVTLEMAQNNDSNITIDAQNIFDQSKTVWIQGDAGSGKSTFLQWIAIQSASNDSSAFPQLQNTIPILIELRSHNCKNLSIKHAIDTIMIDCDCTMPDNWLTQLLESGQALILIDGVDEVRENDRDNVYDWIEEIRRKYKKAKIIVTSRPQVQERLNIDFSDIKILPMNRPKIEVFLKYWHKAVLVEKLNIAQSEVTRYMKKLLLHIDKSDSIRRMATNPLLCAMICALHYKNGSIISTQRNELYEDCCKMLFSDRDNARDIPIYADLDFSYNEKKIIFSQLAYWMMKNKLVVADKEDVIACIERTLKTLRTYNQSVSASRIFSYLLERSGILRMPEQNKIDFIHKSFQEYLAASEIHQEDDWGLLAGKAFDIDWYETLILSMGFASTKKAEKVINHILKSDRDQKNIVIAAACASNTLSLSSNLREKISAKIAAIIPPRTIKESEALSSVGEFVIPFLSYNEMYSEEEKYLCLNSLRLINSPKALSIVASFLNMNTSSKIISIIGRILIAYTEREIRVTGIDQAISKYLHEKSIVGILNIPESFLTSLGPDDWRSLSDDIKCVKDLTLFDYFEEANKELFRAFKSVQKISVIGSFESLSILSKFNKNIKSLTICDVSRKYDIYALNNFNFPNLKIFNYHTAKRVYITGADLSFLSTATEVGLFLYNSESELLLDSFHQLSELKEVTIFSEYIDDLDFTPLFYNSNVEVVHLKVPKEYSNNVCTIIASQFPKDIRKTIEYFDFPYGKVDAN